MNITYGRKPKMTFIGFSTTIQSEKGDVTCPEFWEKEYTQKYARLWQTIQPETPVEKRFLKTESACLPFAMISTAPLSIAPGFIRGKVPNGLIFMLFLKTIGRFYPAAVVPQRGQAVYGGRKSTPRAICKAPITNSTFGYHSLSRSKAQKTARESHLPQRCRVFYKTYPRSGIDKPGSHTKGRYHKEPLCTCVSRSRAYCFSVAL